MIRVWLKWLDLKRPLLAGFEAPDDSLCPRVLAGPRPSTPNGGFTATFGPRWQNCQKLNRRGVIDCEREVPGTEFFAVPSVTLLHGLGIVTLFFPVLGCFPGPESKSQLVG